MGDHQAGTLAGSPGHRLRDPVFGRGVQAGRGVVQDEQALRGEGAGQSESLGLTAGERRVLQRGAEAVGSRATTSATAAVRAALRTGGVAGLPSAGGDAEPAGSASPIASWTVAPISTGRPKA
ncbi:hypothetical protein [Micromonospora sp. ATA51]|uniref:hypothetical protein n=1 Tax=Micromonospora sp. ATA51 TaxID=2806098 RepID=UPI001EE3BF01|nr:hypothetical protein [Micromonospora sp. ATA51]